MRIPFVAGNWKMNGLTAETEQLVTGLKTLIEDVKDITIAVCPPSLYLQQVIQLTSGSNIQVGAQNMYWEEKGAYTGEISPVMLKDIQCDYVILGHSERRQYFNETDENINKKLKKALEIGIQPIICIGETLDQREDGITEEIVKKQLTGCFKGMTESEMKTVTIAYEPVWAIGTGKTATPDQAQDVHRFIRGWLRSEFGDELANTVRIQYGGSVKPDNASELMSQEDIDGALVGGASLKADSFAAIIKAAV